LKATSISSPPSSLVMNLGFTHRTTKQRSNHFSRRSEIHCNPRKYDCA
jgi:hypothetical protein